MCRVDVIAVGPDAAGLDGPPHAPHPVGIQRPYAGAQAVFGVVGQRNGFRLIFKRGDADHRAENFLLETTHAVVPFDQRRVDVETVAQRGVVPHLRAAGQDLAALVFGDLDIRKDFVELLFRCLRANHGGGIKRIAFVNGGDAGEHLLHKLRVNRLLHQHARRASAHFTLVEEAQNDPFHRLIKKLRLAAEDIFKENIGRLAAQLYGAGDNVFCRARQNAPPHRG